METATPPASAGPDASPAERIERRKRALERELETNMTLKMTSPLDASEVTSRSRYGRARKQKIDEAFYPTDKAFTKPLKSPIVPKTSIVLKSDTPNRESQSLSPHRVYKMNASKSPIKIPLDTLKSDNPSANLIQGLLDQNKALSRFSNEAKTISPGKTEKVYVQKDLIQRREEKTASIMKNMFSPAKSPTKSPHNSSHLNSILERSLTENKNISPRQASLFEHPSVIKSLDFNNEASPTKPTKKKEEFSLKTPIKSNTTKTTNASNCTPKTTKAKSTEKVKSPKKITKTPTKVQTPVVTDSTAVTDEIDYAAIELSCAYQANDLAWARVGSYPFWPCLVTRDPFSGLIVKQKALAKSRKLDIIHVTFLGDNGRRGWVHENMLRVYQGIGEFNTSREQITPEQKKRDSKLCAAFTVSEKQKKAWEIAVTEAEKLLQSPKETRIDLLYEIVYGPSGKPETKFKKEKTIKIEKVDKSMSLSESLFEGLFSGNDSKNDDKDRLDVSDVVTACLDDMVIKTGNIMIQKQSHMDIWLQKAKSKTPEKVNDNLILVTNQRNKKRNVQSDDSDMSVKHRNPKKKTKRTSKDVRVESSSGVDSGDSKRNSIEEMFKAKKTHKSKDENASQVISTEVESTSVDKKILCVETSVDENISNEEPPPIASSIMVFKSDKKNINTDTTIKETTTEVDISDSMDVDKNNEQFSEIECSVYKSEIDEGTDKVIDNKSKYQEEIVIVVDTNENKNYKEEETDIDIIENVLVDYKDDHKNDTEVNSDDATIKNKSNNDKGEVLSNFANTDVNFSPKDNNIKEINIRSSWNQTSEEEKKKDLHEDVHKPHSKKDESNQDTLDINEKINKNCENHNTIYIENKEEEREKSIGECKEAMNVSDKQERTRSSTEQEKNSVMEEPEEVEKKIYENQEIRTSSPVQEKDQNSYNDKIENNENFAENQKTNRNSSVQEQVQIIDNYKIKENINSTHNQEKNRCTLLQEQEQNSYIDEECKILLENQEKNRSNVEDEKEEPNIINEEHEESRNATEKQERSTIYTVQDQSSYTAKTEENKKSADNPENNRIPLLEEQEKNRYIDGEDKTLAENQKNNRIRKVEVQQEEQNRFNEDNEESRNTTEKQERNMIYTIQEQSSSTDKTEENKNLTEKQEKSRSSPGKVQEKGSINKDIEENKHLGENYAKTRNISVQEQEPISITENLIVNMITEIQQKHIGSPASNSNEMENKTENKEINMIKSVQGQSRYSDVIEENKNLVENHTEISNSPVQEQEQIIITEDLKLNKISENQQKNKYCSGQQQNSNIDDINENKNLTGTQEINRNSYVQKSEENRYIGEHEESRNATEKRQKTSTSSPGKIQERDSITKDLEENLGENYEKSRSIQVQEKEKMGYTEDFKVNIIRTKNQEKNSFPEHETISIIEELEKKNNIEKSRSLEQQKPNGFTEELKENINVAEYQIAQSNITAIEEIKINIPAIEHKNELLEKPIENCLISSNDDSEEISLHFSDDELLDNNQKRVPGETELEEQDDINDNKPEDDEHMEKLHISEDEVSEQMPKRRLVKRNRVGDKKNTSVIFESDTNSSDSEITFVPKKNNNHKNMSKYDNPIFLEYARVKQEQLVDQNPELTEDEIMAFLYNNWFYEEGLKTDAMKSNALEESNIIKGLGDDRIIKKTRKKTLNVQSETKESKAEEHMGLNNNKKRRLCQIITKAHNKTSEVSIKTQFECLPKQNPEIISTLKDLSTKIDEAYMKEELTKFENQKHTSCQGNDKAQSNKPSEFSLGTHSEFLSKQNPEITITPDDNLSMDKKRSGKEDEPMDFEYKKRILSQRIDKTEDNKINAVSLTSNSEFLSNLNLEITKKPEENLSTKMDKIKTISEEAAIEFEYKKHTLRQEIDMIQDNKSNDVSLGDDDFESLENDPNIIKNPKKYKITSTNVDLMQESEIDDTDDEIESPSYEELSNDGSKFPTYEKMKDKVILLEAFDSSFTSVDSANVEEKITEEIIRKAKQNRVDKPGTPINMDVDIISTASDKNVATSTPKHNRRKGKERREKINTHNNVATIIDIDIEDSEGNDTPKRSLRKRNIKKEVVDKDVSLKDLDSSSSSETDSDEPPISAYMKRKTEIAKSKYDDPNFIKYVEVKQDAIMDENPELTQEEIMSFLYNTWLYEECEKSEADKNNANIDTNIVKGLVDFAPVRSKKERKKKIKTVKTEEEEIFIPKDKPARKGTIKSYFNESDSDSDFSKTKKPVDVKMSEVISVDSEIDVEGLNSELEVFLTDMIKPKPNVFKGYYRESLCEICEKPGCIIKCRGHCGGMYHIDCVKKQVEPKPNKSPKRKKKQSRSRKAGESDQSQDDSRFLNEDSESDEKSQINSSIDRILEMTPLVIENAQDFEYQLAVKMKELLEKAPDNDQSLYSTDDELECHKNGTGQCEIVDVIPRLRNSDPEQDASNFKCNDCRNYDLSPCFVCKSIKSPKQKTEIRQRCSINHCLKVYHLECLETWPQTQFNSGASTKKNELISEQTEVLTCPRHVCHTCVCDDPRGCKTRFSADRLAKCVRCPAVYHTFTRCLPAGTEILNASNIICPRHFESSKVPHHVNTSWCFICATGGSLICCEYCPMSFHADCLNIKPPEDGYMCEDCETGRLPLYGEMVWVKLGYYRWWPGVILHPYQVPSNILAMKHSTGEFVVRFLGANDHYWMYRGRVFPYQEGDTGKAGNQRSKLDAEFTLAVEQAQHAYNVLKNREENVEETEDIAASLLPPSYVKLRVNKPIGSLLSRRVDLYEEGSSTQCDCRVDDPDPCGPDTQCLNRVLLTECGPNCQTGDRCNNRYFEKRLYPKLTPKRVAHRGWGLYTLEDIKKGQFVIEYVGELIDGAEFRRRMRRKHEVRDENFYFLTLDKDRMIDAGPKGNAARFMNHCCEPNCETQKWTVLGDIRVGLFAICDIPANNEVTFNYNLECASVDKKRCFCGTKRCSGYIGAKPKQEIVQPKRIKNIDKKTGKRKYTKKTPVPSPFLGKKTEQRKYRTTINSITSAAKSKELTELEQDLEIIRNATMGMVSDTEPNDFADANVSISDTGKISDTVTDGVNKKPDEVKFEIDNFEETDKLRGVDSGINVKESAYDVKLKVNSDKNKTDKSADSEGDEFIVKGKRKKDKKCIDDYFKTSNVGKVTFSTESDKLNTSMNNDINSEVKNHDKLSENSFDVDKPSTSSLENVSISTVKNVKKKKEKYSKMNGLDANKQTVKTINNINANDVSDNVDKVNGDTESKRDSGDSQNCLESSIKRTLILKINDCLTNGHDNIIPNNIIINNLKQNGVKVNGVSKNHDKAIKDAVDNANESNKVLKVAMERCELINTKKEPKSSLRDTQKPLKRKRVSFSTDEIIIGYDNSVISPTQKRVKMSSSVSPDKKLSSASSSYESEFCEFLKRNGNSDDGKKSNKKK